MDILFVSAAEGVTELIARGYRIEYIYILLELNHPVADPAL